MGRHVEYAKMADELLHATPVAGSADHIIGWRPISAYEDRPGALKPLDLADDPRLTVLSGRSRNRRQSPG